LIIHKAFYLKIKTVIKSVNPSFKANNQLNKWFTFLVFNIIGLPVSVIFYSFKSQKFYNKQSKSCKKYTTCSSIFEETE